MPDDDAMLTVRAEQVNFDVSIASLRNCEIECDVDNANVGDTVRFHVTPTDIYGGKYGYVIMEVKLVSYTGDIEGVEITDEGDGWYCFSMPARNVRLYATTGFNVNVTQSELGTIEVSQPIADENTAITVTVTPNDPAHHLAKKVLVNYTVYEHQPVTLELTPDENGQCTFTMPRAAVTVSATYADMLSLAEVLESANANDEVTVSDDLAIVDRVESQGIAFATDGEGNWIELILPNNRDAIDVINTLAGGTITGVFSYDRLNPAITLTEMPEAAENEITIEPAVYPVSLDFAPKPCEVFYVTGYFHSAGGTDNCPNLREWSGNGGQMGVLLDLNLDWARGSMENGKHYKVRGTALLKEAWDDEPANVIRPMASHDDPMALRNYTIYATGIPSSTTGIETLLQSVEAKSVRYYNLQGVELREPADGLNIIVIEHLDGTTTTHKVMK